MTRDWLAAAAIVLATAAAYSPALKNGFIWDDDAYVTQNADLVDADGLRRVWLQPSSSPQYYPLVFTTFWIERRLWGLEPAGYHAVNVALHAANACLVGLLLRRLGAPGAWLAAAVFALHPVHVESAAWVTERKNTLSAFFYLLSTLLYLRFDPLAPPASEGAPAPPRTRHVVAYAAALVCFVAALLSKTVTASLPAAILLIRWWRTGRVRLADAAPLAPFLALGLGFGLFTAAWERSHVGASGAEWDISAAERILIAGRAVWFYAATLVWPSDLAFIYPRWAIDAADARQWVFPVAALALLLVAAMAASRGRRGPLAALLFFGGTLMPALGFFNIYPMRYSFVADHFQYLASLGGIALVVGGTIHICERLPRRSPGARRAVAAARPLAPAAVLLALATLTWRQTHIYRDLETLWTDTIAKNPAAWMAHNNLGLLLLQQQRLADAATHLQLAADLRPQDADIRTDLGTAYHRLGRIDDARRVYEQALAIRPDDSFVLTNLAILDSGAGRIDAAVKGLRTALRVDPQLQPAREKLAEVLMDRAGRRLHRGDAPAAAADLREAFDAAPARADIAAAYAWLLATSRDGAVRDGPRARAIALQLLDAAPQPSVPLLDMAGAAHAAAGDFDAALVIVSRIEREFAETPGVDQLVADRRARYTRGEGLFE